jgi:hypothetical protein
MEIPDIVPVTQFSEFFKLPSGLVLIIILLSGYFTIRIAQRRNALVKDNMDYLDTIFLISATGMTWFLRLALIGFWIYGLVQQPDIIEESEGISLGYLYFLIFITLISSSIDLNAILCRRLLKKWKIKEYRYKWINNLNQKFERNRYRIIIFLSIFSAVFLSYGFLYYSLQGIEFLLFALFYLFMMLMATVPMISVLFWISSTLYYPSKKHE